MTETHRGARPTNASMTATASRTVRPVPRVALAIAVVIAILPATVFSQTTEEMQKAREETAVVYDLGRFFGYVHAMATEDPELALSDAQKREIQTVMDAIRDMSRIEPDWAAERLEYLELDVLTPKQLMDVDMRAIEWQNTRETTSQSGGGGGGGTGTGPMATYAAGGAFNPIIDADRTIGQGFNALYDHIR